MDTYICVQSETWGQSNWEIRKQTHEEAGQRRDGSGGSDEVTADLINAKEIRRV
jgi:hypothetical protein